MLIFRRTFHKLRLLTQLCLFQNFEPIKLMSLTKFDNNYVKLMDVLLLFLMVYFYASTIFLHLAVPILFYEKLLVNLLTWFDLSALILIDQSSFTNVTHINLYFRLRLKFSCMMELSRYPLDRQICDMQIASCK